VVARQRLGRPGRRAVGHGDAGDRGHAATGVRRSRRTVRLAGIAVMPPPVSAARGGPGS
jgi:hypothetical protein